MASEPDPQWLAEAWRGFVDEWIEFARTALAVARAPRRFLRQWSDGEARALNPLACLINALAILTGVHLLTRLALHRSDDRPEWLELLAPAANLINVAIIASLAHFPLRLLGGRRPWRTSLAATVFVVAGPMLPLYLARDALFPTLASMHGRPFYLTMLPLSIALVVYLCATLAGAQRVAWWRPLLALVVGIGLLAGLGALLPHLKLT